MVTNFMVAKEYVASLICPYKNNGAVSFVGIKFHLRYVLTDTAGVLEK